MTAPAHLGGSHIDKPDFYTWLPDIWARLILDYGIESVLDLGCGAGWSTEWFSKRCKRVLGIEGDPTALALRRCDPIIQHDFTQGPFIPRSHYDLGWVAEFVEHVEAKYMVNWMATLQRCQYVAMTFAVPGQGGHHHVNEQLEPYWQARFKQAGFEHVPEETARMRATASSETWGRPTLTFFRNRIIGHPDPDWLLGPLKA
jgi:SAM-dependent methyltransferase